MRSEDFVPAGHRIEDARQPLVYPFDAAIPPNKARYCFICGQLAAAELFRYAGDELHVVWMEHAAEAGRSKLVEAVAGEVEEALVRHSQVTPSVGDCQPDARSLEQR